MTTVALISILPGILFCFFVAGFGLGEAYGRHRKAAAAARGGATNGTGARWRTGGIAPTAAAAGTGTAPLPRTDPELGEIVGYRVWLRCSGHQYLTSVRGKNGERVIWPPNEPMTGTPSDGGHDGVHAWKTMRGVLEYTGGWGIIGRVKLWGEVVEHEDGYRAEFGRVYAIDHVNIWFISGSGEKKKDTGCHKLDIETMVRLRKLYGVEDVPSLLEARRTKA